MERKTLHFGRFVASSAVSDARPENALDEMDVIRLEYKEYGGS